MRWVSTLISQRTFRIWGLAAVLVVAMGALAGGIAFGTTTGTTPPFGPDNCDNPPSSPLETLNGSAFEIDSNANQVVDESGCIDWLDTSTASGQQLGAVVKQDKFADPTDESFTQGTKEDTASPVIESGSIPPNKSDLKAFGVNTETGQATATPANPTGKFLELLWTRVQDPKEDPKSPPGTTNMDFELNQKFCGHDVNDVDNDNNKTEPNPQTCSANGVTPLRTGDGSGPLTDDKLITYDLSKGGTVATMSIRSWNGSAWGSPMVLSGQTSATALALGTVNTSQITAANSLASLAPPLDPRTFGEASISFSALFGTTNTCGQFGSAYLKSRSSDSFPAALKDFVPPTQVNISNCSTLSTTPNPSSGTVGVTLNDSATLSGAVNPTGNIVFKLYAPGDTNCSGTPLLTESRPISSGGTASTAIGYQTTQIGTYRWTATYTSGDANNSNAESGCQEEQVTIGAGSPTITTTPDPDSGTVGVTLNDSATLADGINPQGSIEFNLFAPGDDDCSGPAVFSQTVPVNGNDTYNTTNGYTSDATGTYRWTANYTSSNANNNNAESGCQEEQVTISPAETTIETAQRLFPQDTATLTANAGGPLTGSVTFKLFGPDNATCDPSGAAPKYTETVPLDNGTANTDNTEFSVNAANSGNYKWLVEFNSGDENHTDATSACGKEAFTATIDNDTTTN
jgi:hypothetical protein